MPVDEHRRGLSRGRWVLLWAVVAAAELGVLAPVLWPTAPISAIDVTFRLVGGSFAACGLVAWRRRPDSNSGRLMTATGFGFFVSPLLFQIDHPLAQTVALWLPDLWVLFFVPLLTTYLTGGRLRTRTDRILVGLVLVELLLLAPLYLAVTTDEPTLLQVYPDERLARAVDAVQRALYLAISMGAAAVVGSRWRAASRPGRRAMWPSVAGAGSLLLFAALLTVDLVTGSRSQILLWIVACSLVTVPGAFLAGLLRSRLARSGLADLLRRMRSMQPGDLQAALAGALGDPDLVVAYPRPDRPGFVDANGALVELPVSGGDRSVTVVERAGQPVAALVYDRSLDDDPELVDAVGGAATIALENRELQSEIEIRLVELQASRERIIAAADAERRRIERNLHDGAQQRLVTIALQLALIKRQIRSDPADAEQLVAMAAEELALSLDELRELARGIHPAALEQGLEPALESLAMRSAVPTSVTVESGPRLPGPVELAAYFVASEALTNVGKYARASVATVQLTRAGRGAVIAITDDGVGGADPAAGSGLRGLADRVEALGGRLRVDGRPGGGTVVTAELPLHP